MGERKPDEASITSAIRRYLASIDSYHVKIWGNAFQRPGVPDLVCCVNGQFVGIEVKVRGRRPAPKQQAELDAIRAAGGVGIVASGVGDVRTALELLCRHRPATDGARYRSGGAR